MLPWQRGIGPASRTPIPSLALRRRCSRLVVAVFLLPIFYSGQIARVIVDLRHACCCFVVLIDSLYPHYSRNSRFDSQLTPKVSAS